MPISYNMTWGTQLHSIGAIFDDLPSDAPPPSHLYPASIEIKKPRNHDSVELSNYILFLGHC